MHISEIHDALARNSTAAMEAAFGMLVTFPDGPLINGAATVDTLCSLLSRVSRALQHDGSAMPEAIGTIIASVVGDGTGITTTYAGGAKIVSDHLYRWRGRYLEHAANGGSIG